MSNCNYQADDWSCINGQLLPPFEIQNFIASPCPACNTREFLLLAYRRSKKIEDSRACSFCFSSNSLHSIGWKIAIDTATDVNPSITELILNEINGDVLNHSQKSCKFF
jgi:hypothetical protein